LSQKRAVFSSREVTLGQIRKSASILSSTHAHNLHKVIKIAGKTLAGSLEAISVELYKNALYDNTIKVRNASVENMENAHS